MYATDHIFPAIPWKNLQIEGRQSTPHEMVTGLRPPIKHLRTLFCPCIVRKHTVRQQGQVIQTSHIPQRGVRDVFIGFPRDQSGSLVFIPSTRQILVSADVVYDQGFSSALTYTDKPFHDAITLRPSVSYVSKPSTFYEQTGDIITFAQDENDQGQTEEGREAPEEIFNQDDNTQTENNIFNHAPPTPEPEQEVYGDCAPSEGNLPSDLKRFSRQRKMPSRLTYHQLGENQIWSGAQRQAGSEGERLLIVECAREATAGERSIDAPGSDPSPFSPPPSNMAAMLRLSDNATQQAWIKASRKELRNFLVDNGTFVLEDPKMDDKVTPCMDTYRAKLKSNGTLDKLKVRIVVRGDLQKQQSHEDTWSPTASVKLLRVFLAHAARMKCRVKQLDFIGAFLQANVREEFS
ncbi:MAG: hypothetical protein ACREBR_03580 [bacterium]